MYMKFTFFLNNDDKSKHTIDLYFLGKPFDTWLITFLRYIFIVSSIILLCFILIDKENQPSLILIVGTNDYYPIILFFIAVFSLMYMEKERGNNRTTIGTYNKSNIKNETTLEKHKR